MTDHDEIQYDRIARAIEYIKDNFRDQPSLDDIADAVHLSPYHFQRLFSQWAGISPKKFVQYLSLEHAKTLLARQKTSVSDTAYETGLSGSSRLHDLFVKIECMTPGEFRNGGETLSINYCFAESPFGNVIVASTAKGVCFIAFNVDESESLNDLQKRFPNASFTQMVDKFQQDALFIFRRDWSRLDEIRLHLTGTPFQIKVWESLLSIPLGALSSYGDVARRIGKPAASRAVGSAIGHNPVAYLIPCHRVIQSTGGIGGYLWGATRKSAMIGWEAARLEG